MRRDNNKNRRERRDVGYDKRVVDVRRVAKVHKGGKRLSFSAMVIVGDRKGSVGVGLGKGVDTRSAIEKGERQAVKSMTKIELIGDTIPHEIVYKKGAAQVLLRPAKHGTGVIAGSSVRIVLELAGIESVYGKLLGTNNPIMNSYCTFEALKSLRNARVLGKMSKMRERVELKKEVDKERKIKESKKRKNNKGNQGNGRKRDNRQFNRRTKPSTVKKVSEEKKVKKEDKVNEKKK